MAAGAYPFSRPVPAAAGERARHAGRPLPVRRLRRAAAADRVGPGGGSAAGPAGRPDAVGGERGDDPRPGPVRRLHPRGVDGWASSTRSSSTRAGRARRWCWARPPGASRTSPATGWWSRRRRASRGRCRSGTATTWAGRWSWAGPSGPSCGRSTTGPTRAWPRTARWTPLAVKNLRAYLDEERSVTGGVLPTDRQIVVERFRDELGDWRVCLLSPFGGRVHAPWALAIEARVRDRLGLEVQTMWSDDGIVVRLPEADEAPPARHGGRRPRRGRGAGGGRAGQLGPVRVPVPGERGPGPAAAPAPAGPAHAAVADAAAVGRPAGGGVEARRVPHPAGDVPGVPARRVRPARADRDPGRDPVADGAAGVGGDGLPVALRLVAGLRLRGQLPLRRRRPPGRAPGPGADPRPGDAGRPAGGGGAAGAGRPGGAGRAGGPAPVLSTSGTGPGRPTRRPTCCGGWATSPGRSCGPGRRPTSPTRCCATGGRWSCGSAASPG